MNTELLKYRIAVTLIKGVGPALTKNLIANLGSVEAIFKESQKNLSKIPGIGRVLSEEIANQNVLNRAEKEIEFIEKHNIKPLFYTDSQFPYRLKECIDAPVMIYVKGNTNLNDGKFVSIVGTRNITDNGREICRSIVSDIATQLPSVTILSGLAYGVDVVAHQAALENNIPTIGVLGHGLDRIYPFAHRATAKKMLEADGGLITEYLSESAPDRQHFVQRNRIIAGMSDAIVVVESAKKGGSLITAEYGNNYNRDVFAVPGRISDEWSAGCNNLIKSNKSFLMESADDLIKMMNWQTRSEEKKPVPVQTSIFDNLSDDDKKMIEMLYRHPDGINVNELTVKLKRPYSQLSSQLLDLEFRGLVRCLPGGVYKCN